MRSFRTPHRHVAGTLAELAGKGAVLCEHSRAALLDGSGAGVGKGVHGGHLNLVVVCDPVEDGQGDVLTPDKTSTTNVVYGLNSMQSS